MRSGATLACCILLGLALAGCIDASETALPAEALKSTARPVVVALIDTGIDPYHEIFKARGPPFLPPAAVEFTLSTQGSYQDRREADTATWDGLVTGSLYAFHGTRVLGISFGDTEEVAVLDELGHGTETAGLVAREAPGATILMIEVNGQFCPTQGTTGCMVHSSIADAMEWVAAQEWIDIVSVSLGSLLNKPPVDAIEPEAARYLEASRRASDAGKLVVGSSGNFPLPTHLDYFTGPPWIICVGGGQGAKHGEAAETGRLVDVIANVTEIAAVAGTLDEYEVVAGTSMATPVVAGTLATARGLLEAARYDADDVTLRQQLRDALNTTAARWTAMDWSPTEPQSPELIYELAEQTLPIVAGPIQQGWGFVDGSRAELIAGALLGSTAMEPDPVTSAHMGRYQALREDQWR